MSNETPAPTPHEIQDAFAEALLQAVRVGTTQQARDLAQALEAFQRAVNIEGPWMFQLVPVSEGLTHEGIKAGSNE